MFGYLHTWVVREGLIYTGIDYHLEFVLAGFCQVQRMRHQPHLGEFWRVDLQEKALSTIGQLALIPLGIEMMKATTTSL